ncbi:G2/mitotic-specific cyclin [Tilletia horrida]|uniref:G2/mitotic-specific cyclin n=1 Tax=Tilletia horrida TaxID=155126 RepID=A0AAN6GQB2_9BASI|nr:G2/mitotic-specific cyclin [Tilletia horrida]KAK0566257.1 G2/mitotic-specific cyclin [Tilletia horrida]
MAPSTAASRASARTRTAALSTANSKEENGTKGLTTRSRSQSSVSGTSTSASAAAAAARRRTALGDRTNAARSAAAAAAAAAAADGKGSKTAIVGKDGKVIPTTTTSRSLHSRSNSSSSTTSIPARRLAVPANRSISTASSSRTLVNSTASNVLAGKVRSHSRATKDDPLSEIQDAQVRGPKRLKTESKASSIVGASRSSKAVPAKVEAEPTELPKDYGWENLDDEDINDPLMVAEYHDEIFTYLKELEMKTLASPDYMSMQRDINWNLRGVLADWMIDIHSKFRLLPETLYLSFNLLDRFLSKRTIYMTKLQLVGITAMFIASKYEECLCPAISNFIYVCDSGYTEEEILRAERYMLRVLDYDLSYPNPIHFLRRISKADGYDTQTRTVAKFFMEISGVDHRLLYAQPSLIAAAAFWAARLVLERGPWTPTFVHYSSYTVAELLSTAEFMLDYVCRPVEHEQFQKKYASKKFMRASSYVRDYMSRHFPHAIVHPDDAKEQDWNVLQIDLFAREDIARPAPATPSASTPASSHEADDDLGSDQDAGDEQAGRIDGDDDDDEHDVARDMNEDDDEEISDGDF